LAALFASRLAHADDAACVANHGAAQELRKASKLRAARDKLSICAEQACPKPVQGDCATWLEEVEREIPSLVVSATDGDGRELTDVRVMIDGDEIAKRLDGKPIEVDPGDYTLRLERSDGTFVDRQVVAKTGARNAQVHVEFSNAVGASPALDKSGTAPDRTLVWVFGGVSAVALESFGYFAIKGQSDYSDLNDRCAPACSKSDSDAVKTKFLIADISLGVALVAAGAATYFYLSPPSAKKTVGLAVRPRPRGAFVGLELGL
jgi:hypothetical protein